MLCPQLHDRLKVFGNTKVIGKKKSRWEQGLRNVNSVQRFCWSRRCCGALGMETLNWEIQYTDVQRHDFLATTGFVLWLICTPLPPWPCLSLFGSGRQISIDFDKLRRLAEIVAMKGVQNRVERLADYYNVHNSLSITLPLICRPSGRRGWNGGGGQATNAAVVITYCIIVPWSLPWSQQGRRPERI